MNMAKGDRLKGRKTLAVSNFLDEFEKDDVKKQVDIVSLFNHFDIELKKKGKSYLGICPWHDDKNPSLSVDKDKGLYNCFGCGESGDIFTLTEKMQGCDFKESLTFLKSFKGPINDSGKITRSLKSAELSGPPKTKVAGKQNRADDAEPKVETKVEKANDGIGKDDVVVNETLSLTLTTIAEYYHKKLYDNENAIDYLQKREFDNAELYERFNIGFVDGSMLSKVSDKQKQSLIDVGIITAKGNEHFRNCLTFPIVNDSNDVVGIYGRSISPSSKVPHLYLKGDHKGIFNYKASKVYDEIILTESIIDALSLISLGFENTQSIYGTNGFTDEHLQMLKDDRVKTVILAFDNDEPGKAAAEKIKEKLVSEGFKVKVISPPLKSQNGKEVFYKDWNECLVDKIDSSIIRELISNAEIHEQEIDTNFRSSKDQLGHIFTINEITYRVTGVKDMFISNLRVNIKADINDAGLRYYDNLDLYSARSRNTFTQNLSREFDIEAKRIEKDLIQILEYLERERDRQLMSGTQEEKETELTAYEIKIGMDFLKSKDMFSEIVEDMNVLGYVGEDLNKQLLYLAATSRKLDDPISVMIVSESASGKSLLIDTVARLIPPEEVIAVTSLSEQALNYMEDLSHKFVSLGEIVHSETIEHQIREMLSKKELSRLVTTKETQTGKMVTKMVKIPAIVSLAMSGTKHDMNPENTSRCFMVNADESKDQTVRIHQQQWTKKYSLHRDHEKNDLIPVIILKHHFAQKLLKPVTLVNPFGRFLNFPNTLMRTRRDNDRFIDLIACVCYLRQYQKEQKSDGEKVYVEFDLKDYEIAYNIMINGVLSSSLLEIPRGVIDLYEEIRTRVKKLAKKSDIEPQDVTFTQREIREFSGLNQVMIKRHLRLLVEYEYIILARGGGSRSKGYYRLRDDVSMQSVNLSMIPTPDELKNQLKDQN